MRSIIDTTANAGDTLKVGGDKLNGMTAELFGKADSLFGGRKARIATMGNSHSTSQGFTLAILYSLWRHYSADVYFDWRQPQDQAAFDATRGDVFGIGGTTTTQMVSTQLPKFQAAIAAGRVYDLLYIVDTGYNDIYSNETNIAAGVANVITTANAALAAGVKLVVIVGSYPQAGTPAWVLNEVNQRLRIYASVTAGVAFCDVGPALLNPNAAATSFAPIGTDNAYGGIHGSDGTHLSANGSRRLAALLAPYHQVIARRRVPRLGGSSGAFDQVAKPRINVFGDVGSIQGTAGLRNDGFNTGVAGTSNLSRFNVADGGGASLVATPSIITGADGFNRQRIAFSGTGGGQIRIDVTLGGITNLNNGVLTRGYDFEMVVELTGVTGLAGIFPRLFNINFPTGPGGPADLWPDSTTETLFVYNTVPQTVAANTANPGPSIYLDFPGTAGHLPAGTADFSRMSLQLVSE